MSMVFRHFNAMSFTMRYIEFDIKSVPIPSVGEQFFFYLKDYDRDGVVVTIKDGKITDLRNICHREDQTGDWVRSLSSEIECEPEKFYQLTRSNPIVKKFRL